MSVNPFRSIPKMDKILEAKELQFAPRWLCKKVAQKVLEEVRQELQKGLVSPSENLFRCVVERTKNRLCTVFEERIQPVINATGVLLHTGLGRAPLPKRVREAMLERASYLTLEIEVESGKRGVREASVARLLSILTGAPAATVVNNNAGATLIALASLAAGREVIVSRGQLVEIGGSFRIPEIMAQSGAKLKEVGCTNKTHLRDYERAITEETALILEVHTSNYRILGFHEFVPTEKLVQLGRKYAIPVMYDMGSGNLVDLKEVGVRDEPTVQEKWQVGVDLITFSGDKLLGGPQSGILVGGKKWIQKIRRHPLFRALRPDKLTLSALEETLFIYLEGKAWEEIPCLRMLKTPLEEVKERGEKWIEKIKTFAVSHLEFKLVEAPCQMGSGALPLHQIPSFAVAIRSRQYSVDTLAKKLRLSLPRVFSRIEDDWVLLHVRTVLPEEEEKLWEALERALLE